MTRVTPPQSARQQRHLAFVSEFTTDLRHTPGTENVVADALSRPPTLLEVPSSGLPVLAIPPVSLPPAVHSPLISQNSPWHSLPAQMCKACWFLLEGRQFSLMTDHKPLVASMTRVTPPQSARQQRHLAFVSEFTTDLRHTPGTENVVADALSRPPTLLEVPSSGLPVLAIPPVSLPPEPPRQNASQVAAADAQPI
ncbi:MAG: hypothetical protein ACK55Z_09890, partial [bacterium]